MNQVPDRRQSLIALLILACIAIWLILVLMRPFYAPLSYAVVLAIAFQPLYQWLSKRIHNPALASLATVLVLLLAVLLPLSVLGGVIVSEARQFYAGLAEQSAEQGGWTAYFTNLIDPPVQWLADRTGMPAPNLRAMATQKMQGFASVVIAWGGSLVGNLSATIGNALLSLVLVFFLFLEGFAIRDGIIAWMPLRRERTERLLRTITDSIVANVYGIAAVGAAQGTLVGLAFLFTGLPSPVMWGAIAAFASLVPIVGPALVWVPGAIFLGMRGMVGRAVFVTFWGLFIVGMSDNILRPIILRGRTEMHTLIVFFALVGGMNAFGFLGLFAGPVIFAVAISVFQILREEYLDAGPQPT